MECKQLYNLIEVNNKNNTKNLREVLNQLSSKKIKAKYLGKGYYKKAYLISKNSKKYILKYYYRTNSLEAIKLDIASYNCVRKIAKRKFVKNYWDCGRWVLQKYYKGTSPNRKQADKFRKNLSKEISNLATDFKASNLIVVSREEVRSFDTQVKKLKLLNYLIAS